MRPEPGASILGRKVEFYSHGADPSWGYEKDQTDSFAVIRPECERAGEKYPLYVVFHSAGHDLFSTIKCMLTVGDHDIYHTPRQSFALVLDCYQNKGDWWWGGACPEGTDGGVNCEANRGTAPRPVERRVIDTVLYVRDSFPVDAERVYAVGNSMGGSGCLGIAYPRGDIFAAVKANVPAGVEQVTDRCAMLVDRAPGFSIPDPPVTVDYSSQCDEWSGGHEKLYRGVKMRKYPLIGFSGTFGHANNNADIKKHNDLIHSFDIGSVRLHDPYPVFTDASTDDPIPWPDRRDSDVNGQVNAFFRWRGVRDEEDCFEIELRLLRPDEWESRAAFPEESVADVSVRRRQKFILAPGERFAWEYGGLCGEGVADGEGLPTVARVKVTREPTVLRLRRK